MTPATIEDAKNLLWTIQDNLAGMGDDSWSLRLDVDSLTCMAVQLKLGDTEDLNRLMEETSQLQAKIDGLEKLADRIRRNLMGETEKEEESK